MNEPLVELPPFELGQQVYVAWSSSYAEHQEPCPICFGNRSVVLILGNGEQLPIECEMCGHGFEGPRGYIMAHGPASGVRRGTVTGLSKHWDKWEIEVEGSHEDLANIFLSESEAEARRVVLHETSDADAARRRFENERDKRKSLTWKAGYHRRCIKQAEHDIAYHQARLAEIPEKKRAAL